MASNLDGSIFARCKGNKAITKNFVFLENLSVFPIQSHIMFFTRHKINVIDPKNCLDYMVHRRQNQVPATLSVSVCITTLVDDKSTHN